MRNDYTLTTNKAFRVLYLRDKIIEVKRKLLSLIITAIHVL